MSFCFVKLFFGKLCGVYWTSLLLHTDKPANVPASQPASYRATKPPSQPIKRPSKLPTAKRTGWLVAAYRSRSTDQQPNRRLTLADFLQSRHHYAVLSYICSYALQLSVMTRQHVIVAQPRPTECLADSFVVHSFLFFFFLTNRTLKS